MEAISCYFCFAFVQQSHRGAPLTLIRIVISGSLVNENALSLHLMHILLSHAVGQSRGCSLLADHLEQTASVRFRRIIGIYFFFKIVKIIHIFLNLSSELESGGSKTL